MPRSNSIRTDRATPNGDPFAQGYARLRAKRPLRKLRLQQIASDLRGGRAESAQDALRGYLATQPNDADALFLEAQTAERLGRNGEAVTLFTRCLEFAPDFAAARYHSARLHLRLHHYESATREVEQILAGDRRNPLLRRLQALIFDAVGEEQQSLAIWKELADEYPGQSDCWIRFGEALRATGNQASSIAAFRRAIGCRQSYGQAWWSLANMKTFRFTDEDISAMRTDLDRSDTGADDRVNLLFALGKAYEDKGAFAKSFEHYAKGNAARRLRTDYDWDDINSELAAQKKLFTREFMESRSGAGCKAPDPIFILGRPRAGSTLIEQILSSHSAVEGTAELPHIADFAWRFLEGECVARSIDYPQILAELPTATLTAMGEEYMERTRIHRKLGRPFFIDKSPANYHHVGMIILILPNAKIIDARRNPAACCFSMFKHNYSETNLRLAELGLVYRNYVELMAHFDRVMPGRIHRVIYENMVGDPEAGIRSLLDYLQLPFEENCLRFYATERTIRTPSSEQVRRPISGEAVGHWRHFEPWLRPLLDSLGSVLREYPCVPEDLR